MRETYMLSLFALMIGWAIRIVLLIVEGEPGPRTLMSLFGWEPILYGLNTDMFLGFLLPLFTVGMAKMINGGTADKSSDDPDTADFDYIFMCFLGMFFATLGYLISFGGKQLGWIPYGNFAVLPVCGIVLIACVLFESRWWKMPLPAALVGFFSAAIFLGGVIHQWVFPWAIMGAWILLRVIVPAFVFRYQKAPTVAHS